MKNIKSFVAREKVFLLVALAIGFIITIFTSYTRAYSQSVVDGLSNNLIRFHVVANSDSDKDQALKLAVRDAVLDNMKDKLNSSTSIEETRSIISENISAMKGISEDIIDKYGYDYVVDIRLGDELFPTKKYGDIVLPAGMYESVNIIIGEGKGHNWWCVMFPPLCFVDVTHGVVPEDSKETLKEVLTEDEYSLVVSANNEEDIPVKVKFKVVEWWQNRKLESDKRVAKQNNVR